MPPKVLIVDDEPGILMALTFLVSRAGYEVHTATSGEGALESILQHNPDLILLDIMLPGIDGFEVCEIVRLDPRWRHVKIVFLTACGREEDRARGLVLGADEYITKPYANQEVMAAVQRLLGGGGGETADTADPVS
jgi:DNA-binding response OmpR family regulator